jgi:hypothetical protein
MSSQARQIIIKDFLMWCRTEKPLELLPDINHPYSNAYYNVIWYDEDVEKFLIENKIDYKIKVL